MAQAMADMGLASEMAQLQDALRQARPDLPWGQRGQVPDGEHGARAGRRHQRRRRAGRPRGAVEPALAGLRGRLARRHRRGAARAGAGPPGRRRPRRRCASSSASCERQGYLNRDDGKLELSPQGGAPARRDGAAPGVRQARRPPAAATTTSPTPAPPGELTGSSREWRFGDEQPLDVVRTVKNAVLRTAGRRARGRRRADRRRGLRGRRDRAAHRRRRRAAGRPLLLDGAARHVGRGEVDGDGAALAGHDALSRRTPSRSSASPPPRRCCGRRRWPSCPWTRCRAPTCSTG